MFKNESSIFPRLSALSIGFIASLDIIILFQNLLQDIFSLERLRKIQVAFNRKQQFTFLKYTYMKNHLAEQWIQTANKKVLQKARNKMKIFLLL